MKRRKRNRGGDDDDNGFAAWGGYMAAKKSKLLEQFSEDVNEETNIKSKLFKGVSIFVNGYTNPTAEELKQIMTLHGGVYHTYHIPAKTRFIIASNLPDVKVKQIGSADKIVKPEWITDSLKQERLLDYRKYLLYTNSNRKQPKLNFVPIEKEKVISNQLNKENVDGSGFISPELFSDFDDSDGENSTNYELEIKDDQKSENNNVQEEKNFKDLQIEENIEEIRNEVEEECDSTNTKINESIKKANTTDTSKVSDKTGRTLTAVNPKFLSEFYNNSRLHHIATLGATFKQYVCNLREQSKFTFPERQKFIEYLKIVEKYSNIRYPWKSCKKPVIMHIDMDCFFVSVGLRKRPELRGLPVAVTHSKGGQEPMARSGVDRQAEMECYKQRLQEKFKSKNGTSGPENVLYRLEKNGNQSMSEVASCSYEARKAGVRNGMFMGTALQLCPNLQTIPYDFEEYKEVAYTLYNTISEYTLSIEGVSCDEMFVDITELLEKTNATVEDWASYIRSLIQKRTGCPCSAGFGSNRLQARIATATAKPNGQFYLKPDDVEEYMLGIKVDDLPGVGRSTSIRLASLGIHTCGELQDLSLSKLQAEFGGKVGETLYSHCRGIDDRPLVYEHERKSVSAEVNYGIRFTNNTEVETFLKQLSAEVHARLSDIRMKGKCLTLKLMVRSKNAPLESSKFMGHGVCDYINKSTTFATAVNDLNIITKEVLLLAQKLTIPPTELRGVGIQISKLEKPKKVTASALAKFLSATNTANKEGPPTNSKQTGKLENSITKNEDSCFKKPENLDALIKMPIKIKNDAPVENININTLRKIDEITENARKNFETPINKNKSLVQNTVISKRGRPKGGTNNRTIVRKKSSNGSLHKFFGANDNSKQECTFPPEIDLQVLSELPEDIRREVMQQYNIKEDFSNKIGETSSKTNNELDSTTKNDENPEPKPENSEEVFMFGGMDFEDMRKLFSSWISSQNAPEPCDIKILGEYLRRMALMKKIEELYVMLKFLHSEILFKRDCAWHKVYFEIAGIAQEGMIASYGYSIYINQRFDCAKCKFPIR